MRRERNIRPQKGPFLGLFPLEFEKNVHNVTFFDRVFLFYGVCFDIKRQPL